MIKKLKASKKGNSVLIKIGYRIKNVLKNNLRIKIGDSLETFLRWQNLYVRWKAIKCACTMIIKT